MNWVKVKGSDIVTVYPQVRVDEPDGIHFHYEDDKTHPEIKQVIPTLLEDNGDGTYTKWGFTLYGPVGQTGELREGIEVVCLETKADFREAGRLERALSRAMETQSALASTVKGAKNA